MMERMDRGDLDALRETYRRELAARNESIAVAYQSYKRSTSMSKLCISCWCIFNQFEHLLEEDFSSIHLEDISQLEISAKDGCTLCAQFLKEYHSQPYTNFPSISGSVCIKKPYIMDPPPLHFHLKMKFLGITLRQLSDTMEPEFLELSVEMHQISSKDSIECLSSQGYQGGCNTVTAISLCRIWLNKCCLSHELCKSQAKFLPTRLIDTQNEHPKLVLGAQLKDMPRYATLSHCWGSSSFLTLAEGNFQEFCNQIPTGALSKTFRDSFLICRTLGLRYIWIDSLCIFQDSKEDWRREAAMMTNVYEGSYINIAASGASNGNVGCFFDRGLSWRCQVKTLVSKRTLYFECIFDSSSRLDRSNVGVVSRLGSSIDGMPLHKRGWVIQERLLSPRTLLFTSTQVFWECFHNKSSELFPNLNPLNEDLDTDSEPIFARDDGRYDSFEHDTFSLTDDRIRKQPITGSMWGRVVDSYSECNLTHGSDKLIAISGIARKIQRETNDQYVAGLWRKNLEGQLCWTIDCGESEIPKCQQLLDASVYRAPSWSWAFIDHTVISVFLDHRGKLVEVLHVDITLAGGDPFGEILKAELTLQCYALLSGTPTILTTRPYCGVELIVRGTSITIKASLDQCHSDNDSWKTRIGNKIYLLPVNIHPSIPSRLSPNRLVRGLLLQPTHQAEGQFRRLGSFLIFHEHAGYDLFTQVCDDGGSVSDEVYACNYRDKSGALRDDGIAEKVIILV